MEVSGIIKKILPEQTFKSSFRKQELVITTQEQYPQDLLIEFTQDRIGLLEGYQEGEQVKVSINLRGREWINPEGVAKYFNSINGWRIEKMDQAAPSAPSDLPPIESYSNQDFSKDPGEEDDLPF